LAGCFERIKMDKECKWTEDDAGDWDSDCGDSFIFNNDGPVENHFKFCPYCGRKLKQINWPEEIVNPGRVL